MADESQEMMEMEMKMNLNSSTEEVSADFSALPVELLQAIYSLLDTESRLTALDVCKTWRRAGREDGWWGRLHLAIHHYMDHSTFTRILTKAPYLSWLCVDTFCPPCMLKALLYRSPAIFGLVIFESEHELASSSNIVTLLTLLRRQAAHVRHLRMIGFFRINAKNLKKFWHIVNKMSLLSLEVLELEEDRLIHRNSPSLLRSSSVALPRRGGGLKRLSLHGLRQLGPVAQSLILANTETLQVLSLRCGHAQTRSSPHWMAAIARCSNLSDLDISVRWKGISLLSENPLLARLRLRGIYRSKGKQDVSEAASLLRESTSLRYLHLYGLHGDLVEAVAQGKSSLQELALERVHDVEPLLLRVSDMLRGQPQLEKLSIQGVLPEEVLDSISPATCPKLRLIDMSGMCRHDSMGDIEPCIIPPVLRLCKRYPEIVVKAECVRFEVID